MLFHMCAPPPPKHRSPPAPNIPSLTPQPHPHNKKHHPNRPILPPAGRVSRTTSLFMDMKDRSLVERVEGAVEAARAWLWQFRVCGVCGCVSFFGGGGWLGGWLVAFVCVPGWLCVGVPHRYLQYRTPLPSPAQPLPLPTAD